jgi:hypothetical protein
MRQRSASARARGPVSRVSAVTSPSSVTARRRDKGTKRFLAAGGTPPATRVAALARLAPAYQPRRPTETILYRAVHETLEMFLAHPRLPDPDMGL